MVRYMIHWAAKYTAADIALKSALAVAVNGASVKNGKSNREKKMPKIELYDEL